ncbi:MAG: hypothetical protein WC378_03620 [Opitutaceae bacterium]|jgi:hypothetical protein
MKAFIVKSFTLSPRNHDQLRQEIFEIGEISALASMQPIIAVDVSKLG